MSVVKFKVFSTTDDGNSVSAFSFMDLFMTTSWRPDRPASLQITRSDDSVSLIFYDEAVAESLYGRTIVCSECGDSEDLKFYEMVNFELYKTELCHTCHFWIEKFGWTFEPDQCRAVRVNHKHYAVGENTDKGFRGFGGRAFRIRFHSGSIVETTNLWSQGDIPERFWDRLPDNAVFEAVDTRPWHELPDAKYASDYNDISNN